tara:strand:- start:87 stop:668 length:582 start_codon:yes stop_codon:yes gene_type:complete
VRYLHSDIDTVERVEIIRDLRLGVFDVLIGINLLREGLDIPEVSLVAILDADKEGFLRSYRSLIQTIGRAARNIDGKAILYADKITDSIKNSVSETERRREKQLTHNVENNIIPRGVKKLVKELIDGLPVAEGSTGASKTVDTQYLKLSKKDLAKEIRRLEKEMLKNARELEFEKAALSRDKLEEAKAVLLEL